MRLLVIMLSLTAGLASGLFTAPIAGPASAQLPLPGFPGLLGSQQAEEPQQSRPSPGSFSPTRFDPQSVPSAEAYGTLPPETNGTALIDRAPQVVGIFRNRLVAVFEGAPQAMHELRITLAAASKTGQPGYFLGVAIYALFLLVIGRAMTQLFAVYVARPLFVGLQRAKPVGYREKLPVLAYRILLTVVGSLIAVASACAVGLVYYSGHEATLYTVLIIFGIYGFALVLDAIWRMVLCPFLPNYRLPRIDDGQARALYLWITTLSSLALVFVGFGIWVHLLGLPQSLRVLFSLSLSALVVLGFLALMRANAGTIRDMLLSGRSRAEVSWVTLVSLRLWAPVGVLYLLVAWTRTAFDLVMGVETGPLGMMVPYAIVLGGLLTYALAAYVIERVFSRSRDIAALNRRIAAERRAAEEANRARIQDAFARGDSDDGGGEDEGGAMGRLETVPPEPEPSGARLAPPRRGMRTYEDLARRVASLFAIGTGAYALFYFWGGAAIFGETMVLGVLEDVIDIVFIGYICFHAVRIWMGRKIEEEVGDDHATTPGEGEGGGTGATRLATLLPLVRNFVLAVILLAIALVVATEVGFNVAPLFAGAGIVGLAIGFGSQTLVRDILSGAFFLMDDAFRKGEYIDVGEVKGTVEKISIRSFQLRHHLGMLHTIPFGEIRHLTNFSRDWVMMKLPLRLTYDTDIEKVRKLIKKLGQQLMEDPELGPKFLQPLKSQGVIEMQDSAMIVRVKFMCRPGEQWVIRKRVYHEIRQLFEREGIHFAHREVTVHIPGLPQDRPLSDTEQRAIGSAARASIDAEDALAMTGTGGMRDDR